jgi:hypothetical protein
MPLPPPNLERFWVSVLKLESLSTDGLIPPVLLGAVGELHGNGLALNGGVATLTSLRGKFKLNPVGNCPILDGKLGINGMLLSGLGVRKMFDAMVWVSPSKVNPVPLTVAGVG